MLLVELARVSAAMAMAVQCAHIGIASIYEGNSKAIKDKYLPALIGGEAICAVGVIESAGGSDPTGNATEAADMGDHFVLNGRKTFISNSYISEVAMVLAKTEDIPQKEFTALLVDRRWTALGPAGLKTKLAFMAA